MSEKLWDGRFSEKTSRSVERFTSSIDIDRRLYPYDIEGSIAHCKTLAKAGIITDDEASTLVQGLGVVKREIAHGDFLFDHALEDIHMHIEARLFQEVGKVAQKLHTARSRNDQVALDIRMFLRDKTRQTISHLTTLRRTLIDMARIHIDVIMPGYTHLQHAQPVLFSHHLMAYCEMFKRDCERFQDALERIDVMPLGSAALAGTTYPIDRHYTAQLLEFSRVSPNSMDAVSDRDFILEYLAHASICMVHFSRISEEIVLWSSSEFNFIEMPDAFATGSSIMPQKKNPDVPELVRGKTGGVFGDLLTVLTLMKSLPLTYNRDMQEDKLPLFRSVDTLCDCIEIYIRMLPNIHVNKEHMLQAASVGFLNATDLADYLVGKGMTFREAHGCVGKAVGFAIQQGKELNELSLKELKNFSSLMGDDVFSFIAMDQMIGRRTSFGGTAKQNVVEQIAKAENEITDAK